MRLGGHQSHCKNSGKGKNLLHVPQMKAIISHEEKRTFSTDPPLCVVVGQ
jgi:hypothetical protein